MPSLEVFRTDRPAYTISVENLKGEIYGLSDDRMYADPVLIRVGKGAVVKICMDNLRVDRVTRVVLICEFILNRMFNLGGVKVEKPFPVIPISIAIGIVLAIALIILILIRRR